MHSSFYLTCIPEKIIVEESSKFNSAGIHKYHNLESSDWKQQDASNRNI